MALVLTNPTPDVQPCILLVLRACISGKAVRVKKKEWEHSGADADQAGNMDLSANIT